MSQLVLIVDLAFLESFGVLVGLTLRCLILRRPLILKDLKHATASPLRQSIDALRSIGPALLAIELPACRGFEAIHDETADVFKAMRSLEPGDLVRGQYTGYRNEPGVAKHSDVETLCALRLFIDSWRWGSDP